MKSRFFRKNLTYTVPCLLFFGMLFFTSCSKSRKTTLYRNNLKNWDFGKEAPQNFDSERATIAERQGASENQNSEEKPTQSKTDSSSCFGINLNVETTKILEEDEIWMNKFFKDFFLETPAIYTLFGSKPMSMVTIVSATEKEWINSSMEHWKNLQDSEKDCLLQEIKDYVKTYDLDVNWEKWINWHKKHPQSNFLFLTQKTDSNHLFNAYVINVKSIESILQKHYNLFSKTLKMEFNPLDVALDFENPNSNFWTKVFSNPLLEGILFGYGKHNASLFFQEFEDREKKARVFDACSSVEIENSETSQQNIELPLFRSYHKVSNEDPIVKNYKIEREKIKKRLNGKIFEKEVLNMFYANAFKNREYTEKTSKIGFLASP